jgi:hypothetical protein
MVAYTVIPLTQEVEVEGSLLEATQGQTLSKKQSKAKGLGKRGESGSSGRAPA